MTGVMDHPKEEGDSKVTVKAVIVEAERLRNRAQMDRAIDPFAKPYSPSEATARGLSQRMGPEEAILELKRRAADAQAKYREETTKSDHARKRLERQHQRTEQEHRHRLSRLTLGQRLDEAFAGLVTVSEVSAVTLNPDPVTKSKSSSSSPPKFEYGRDRDEREESPNIDELREAALKLIERVEAQVPRTHRRIRGAA